MRSNYLKTLKTAVLAATILLLGVSVSVAQQQVSLTAGPTTQTMPDGSVVPMWGYTCGSLPTGVTSTATCAALNPASVATTTTPATWSPVVITVPTGQTLQINLTNNLSFTPTGSTTANTVPTSLVIVGQLGGGLGVLAQRTTTPSPDHTNAQPLTWPIAGDAPGAGLTGVGTPPVQGPRVQSFSTEVAAGATTSLTWTTPRPGTYLIESGTHPSIQGPMGLYGILVVTTAPAAATTTTAATAGCAYPGASATAACLVPYNAEIPLLFSEIDPVQNASVSQAVNTVGFSETEVWTRSPGVQAGPITSIAVNLPGTLYTLPPVVTITGTGANATAVATIAGGLVTGITITNAGDGYAACTVASATCPTPTVVTIAPATGDATGSGATATATVVLGGCGGRAHTCYPPAVNYSPLYYLINGLAFDKTHATASLFSVAQGTTTGTVAGTVLVRMVNAGLRMHVPSIVGSQTGTAVAPAAPPSGFSLIAEDGNPLPGVPRVQSEVFMAAGKAYDVMVNVPASGTTALPIFDRELSLAGNSVARDGGMLAYISVNGAGLPASSAIAAAVANPDPYPSLVPCAATPCPAFTVSDPGKGVIANDINVYGVQLLTAPTHGTVILNADGTFSYTPASAGTATADSFIYCANGSVTGTTPTCSSGLTAKVSLNTAAVEAATAITCAAPISYSANATTLSIKPPGVLAFCKDTAGYPLAVNAASVTPGAGLTLSVDPNGGFNASVTAANTYTFTFKAQNSQGTVMSSTATATLVFPVPTGLAVTVKDGKSGDVITDYRWIIEEDRTFYVNPGCTTNPPATGCPGISGIVPTFGTNFHTSYMPVVAAGCTGALSCESGQTMVTATGAHVNAICDIGNGVCRPDPVTTGTGSGQPQLLPSAVHLDPTKHYYISILPGDAANPFEAANLSNSCVNGGLSAKCGHGMGGAPIACVPTSPAVACTSGGTFPAVTILTQPTPFPPSKLSVFVFEDDFPLNGEQDGGGGIDVLSPNEPGLGGFNITLFDDAGGTGDATGQMTYDMFNQPLSNSLAGTIDPLTTLDACPVSTISRIGTTSTGAYDITQTGLTGTIVTCPKFESDGKTLSPLAGQVVVANLMPGRYGVVATPAADRIARGEEWLQTNTLDGQKAHDSFLRIGEPSFFQEYGPAGYHVSIGFANPGIINNRKDAVCDGSDPNVTGANCTNTLTGLVTTERMSRTPDERLFSSGDNSSFAFTQCYVSFGDADGEDFAFTKCNADGTFTLSGLPNGDWRITVFDQWNDMLVDGLSTPVRLSGGTTDLGQIAMNQWQANIYTSTFFDANGNGVRDSNEQGLTLVSTNIRFRDGSYSNFNNTDLNGNAGFNEVFPLFSWYVVETDTTRYKSTGTHVVYDAGGPADGTPCGSTTTPPTAPCGNSAIAGHLANTFEQVSVPVALRVPGAVYCATGDCTGKSIAAGPGSSDAPSVCTTSPTTGATTCTGTPLSTGRIDPPWVATEGWQGFSGQNSFIEFGKRAFQACPPACVAGTTYGENGGIHGEVIYASTRPFDDPMLLIHTSWTPDVPGVTINLYQEGFAADGVTPTLKLVDTTKTSSWDDWAQGFYPGTNKPFMNCPGQFAGPTTSAGGDLFFFTLFNQPMWLDLYNNAGTPAHTIPNNSQFKCFDGMHNWNQLQPAVYDGMYQFPSIIGRNPTTGAPTGSGGGSLAGTACKICRANPIDGTPMLPPGKYVVEMIVPPGYELVKEEDKNILIGDNYIVPATQEFPGLGGAIYILPDQAEVSAYYNANNAQNPTNAFGRTTLPSSEGDTGSVEVFWPCVGQARIVPDYISLFPQSHEVAPFAGALRNLCDRKEVALTDQASVLAKFWIFSSTHVAAHFTGVITDDYTSEFDPFSPQFGEKFSPPNLPVSIKDWSGTEISRVYADQWGTYDGLTYSTWEVNPPNPTGYAPTMMVTCMNDPGTGPNPDPLYNPEYSQFCYEIPFMPGQTQYMDTPVVPTSAFAGAGYNNPDCSYPTLTPAIKEVDGDGIGPWVSAAGGTLKITALGDQTVPNYGYSGPSATTAPFNQKTITKHYGFGPAPAGGCSNGTPNAACPNVTVGGIPLHGVTWTDTTITGTVQANVPLCTIQQQAQYAPGATPARCGELVITAVDGKQSIDTVTVTIGGSAPTHVPAAGSIQAAIDAAHPGDLIIVDPTCGATTTATGVTTTLAACTSPLGTGQTLSKTAASHQEVLLMWKPVRLQGVGAASSVINANTHPAGKMDAWRRQVNCMFGLAINGSPVVNPTTGNAGNPYDPSGAFSCGGSTGAPWAFFNGYGAAGNFNPQVDRLPLEAAVGWDANLNGNLAELLQEPSLMGALEGAGITVLGKGVNFPANSYDPTLLAAFPTGTRLLLGPANPTGVFPTGDLNANCTSGTGGSNPFPSNYQCNPSSIDGLTITNSSQGGGGIFVHGWGHNLQIANNRITNNAGTLSGGINVGQGEFAPSYTQGGTNADPGSCQTSTIPGVQLPYCEDLNVNVHHNAITANSSTGDELFSATPAGAGGVSVCTGSDYYKFNYNWVCGNLSTGDGGGFGQLGFSYNGDVEHNTILFNQSTNPTIPTNGGGMIVMGTPDADPTCGTSTDQDCVPNPPVAPSDGVGPNLVINANLIMGNGAESGSGGGIQFQHLNGTDVTTFPTTPSRWYQVNVTNNIIANNVAGWDGAGISLLDALNVNIINNTIMSNDTTASSGVLFNTLGAPRASTPGPCPVTRNSDGTCPVQVTGSTNQPAGLVVQQNSSNLTANLPATITCPTGHFAGTTASNGTCRSVSYPELYNDVFYQNRAFNITVGGLGTGGLNQQNVVALVPTLNQPSTAATTPNGSGLIVTGGTGACVSGANYWDIGVRGDTGPDNHASGVTLAPSYSVLTDVSTGSGYSGAALHNTGANPTVLRQYCNGSRVPPENGGLGYNVPPGIADATVPNPIFNLTPNATVDEGNNWINISWGPLALVSPSSTTGTPLGDYGPAAGSSVINYIPSTATTNYAAAPSLDFYGNARKNGFVDAGAVEFAGTTGGGGGAAAATLTPATWTVAQTRNCPGTGILGIAACLADPVQMFTLTNTGTVTLTGITRGTLGGTAANVANYARVNLISTCGPAGSGQLTARTTLAPGATCVVAVAFRPLTAQGTGLKPATISVTDSAGTQTSNLNGTAN